MMSITERVELVRQSIGEYASQARRAADSVTLLAVSKTRSADELRQAATTGLTHFGENYLQEAVAKIEALEDLSLTWHFIGPLQSNKTRLVATHFDWVHSIDRLKIARRLSEQRQPGQAELNVCLQVNISGEASKSGVEPAELPALAAAVADLPRLSLRGLMALPAPHQELELQRRGFAELSALQDALNATGLKLDTLSMGTSADLRAAILEGATVVRIGTALFGPRQPGRRHD